jgi:outer membrane receptor protein involved in Fe transport
MVGITHAGGSLVSAGLRFTRTGPQFLRGDVANEERRLPPGSFVDGLRGDVANEERRLPPHGIAALDGQWSRGRATVALSVDNLFDRRHVTFGTYALNPRGAPDDPDRTPLVERFLTPGYPRSVSLSVTVRN